MITPETAPAHQVLLDPHVGWAIACLLLALVAAVVAFVVSLTERRR
jgi:hypothetical protein